MTTLILLGILILGAVVCSKLPESWHYPWGFFLGNLTLLLSQILKQI